MTDVYESGFLRLGEPCSPPDCSESERANEEHDSDQSEPEQAFKDEPDNRKHNPRYEQYQENSPHILRLRPDTLRRGKDSHLRDVGPSERGRPFVEPSGEILPRLTEPFAGPAPLDNTATSMASECGDDSAACL